LLADVGTPGFTFSKLDTFGQKLAAQVLADDMAKVLATLRQRHLVVVHDAPSSRIPWETLRLGDWSPAADAGLSRRYMAENLSVAKWLEQRRQSPTLNLLLVVNPTRDLQGAEEEGERIRELFGAHASVRIVVRHQQEASKPALLKDFSSGQYDVIHYAGHAYFDREQPARSGILCAGHQVLSGADLAGLSQLPSLVCFNACEAGRIRGGAPRAKTEPTPRERIEQNVGLAEAFLRGGAANYIGTYWPVGDAAAKVFAEVFYGQIMQGKSLGEATLAARQAVQKIKSVDWADYILYGSPEFVVKAKRD
jgi:CHAT domain-containing protein